MKALSLVTILGLFPLAAGSALGAPPEAKAPEAKAAEAKAPEAKTQKAHLPDAPPFTQTTPAGRPAADSVDANANGQGFRISGQIAAARKSELSFKVTGYVKGVQKKAGDTLKAGETLASLDETDYQLALKLAEAKKNQAEIHARSAKAEYDRETQLKQQNASTAAGFEKIQAAYEEARLGVQLADLNLQSARRNLTHAKLVAPYDCIVAEQFKDEGEYVAPGTKVYTVYEVNAAEVDLNVPERLVGKLAVGNEIAINVPSVQFKGKAMVSRVVPVVSDRTRTFRVTAKLKSDDKRVVPGLFAEALLN